MHACIHAYESEPTLGCGWLAGRPCFSRVFLLWSLACLPAEAFRLPIPWQVFFLDRPWSFFFRTFVDTPEENYLEAQQQLVLRVRCVCVLCVFCGAVCNRIFCVRT